MPYKPTTLKSTKSAITNKIPVVQNHQVNSNNKLNGEKNTKRVDETITGTCKRDLRG